MSRITPAARTSQARRVREDDASRLRDEVPDLASLRFQIEDQASFEVAPPVTYIRHVVIAHAPAMFDLPCGDRKCEDGGHDVTRRVLRSLKRHEQAAEGHSQCRGVREGEPCNRELHYSLSATYG